MENEIEPMLMWNYIAQRCERIGHENNWLNRISIRS
jgi:hypothetical protein